MYQCKHFDIRELVSPIAYRDRGGRCWELLDDRMLKELDYIRETFGPTVINTWHSKSLTEAYGFRRYSGLRTMDFWVKPTMSASENAQAIEKYNRSYSQHKYGRAFDCLFRDHVVAAVRERIKESPALHKGITAIEEGVSWLHIDSRNVEQYKLFYP